MIGKLVLLVPSAAVVIVALVWAAGQLAAIAGQLRALVP